MIKAIKKEDYEKFWKEYSTNIKLGIIEDSSNRTRLAKLLLFQSSNVEGMTSLAEYVSRMKNNQKHIYYIAGASRKEVRQSGNITLSTQSSFVSDTTIVFMPRWKNHLS